GYHGRGRLHPPITLPSGGTRGYPGGAGGVLAAAGNDGAVPPRRDRSRRTLPAGAAVRGGGECDGSADSGGGMPPARRPAGGLPLDGTGVRSGGARPRIGDRSTLPDLLLCRDETGGGSAAAWVRP